MAYLANDSFQDADYTALEQHQMVSGPGWQTDPYTNAFAIFTNHAVGQGGTPALAWTDAGSPDVIAQVTLSLGGTNGVAGLLFRFQDEDNYWRATIGEAGNFEVWKRVAGVETKVASNQPSPPIDVNAQYTIQVTLSALTIAAILNGGNLLTLSDPALAGNTQYGIGGGFDNGSAVGMTFYNFSVRKIPITLDSDVVITGDLTVNGSLTVAGTLSCAEVVGDLNLNTRLTFRNDAGQVIASITPYPNTDASGNPAPGYTLQYVVSTGPTGAAVEITTDGHPARELLSLAIQDGTTNFLACHKSNYQVVCHIASSGHLTSP